MSFGTCLGDNEQFAELAKKFGVDLSAKPPKKGYDNVRRNGDARQSSAEIAERLGLGVPTDNKPKAPKNNRGSKRVTNRNKQRSDQKHLKQSDDTPIAVTTVSRRNKIVRTIGPNYSAAPDSDTSRKEAAND